MNRGLPILIRFRKLFLRPGKGINNEGMSLSLLPFTSTLLIGILLFATEAVNAQNCTLNANVDQTICANEVLTLVGGKGGLFSGSGTTTWSQESGPSVIITSPNDLVTTVTGIQGGFTYKFRLSTECLDGSLIYDEVSAMILPITFANAGPDQGPICPGVGVLAGNNFVAGETGVWSIQGSNAGGISITTPSSPVSGFTASGTSAGTSTLRWEITGGNGCVSYDEMTITNRGADPVVNAGPDQVLSNCFSLTTATTLAGSFGGNNISGQIGLWTVISGPNIPTINNPTVNTSAITNLIQGIYILRWTVTGPCSTGYDEMQITVPAPVGSVTTAVITPGNTVYCDGRTSIVFSGTYPMYGNEVVAWTKTAGPAVTIASPVSPTTNVTGFDGSSTYTFNYTITNTVTGCSSTANSSISYATPPSLTITTASPIIAACNANSATISYTQAGSGSVEYSIVSAPAGFPGVPTPFAGLGASPATISGLTINGTYVIQLRKSALGTGCSDVFQAITVITSVTPSNSNAGTKQLLACNVISTALVGSIPTIGIGSWSQVLGPNAAVISEPNNANTNISGLISGLYRFRWKISGGPACPTRQSDAQVVVSTLAPTAADAGPDQTVCFNTPVYLAGNTPILNETGTWTVSPSAGVTFSPGVNTGNAVVTGLLANTVYTFTWTIENACAPPVTDQVFITTTSVEGPVASDAGTDQCLASGTTSITLNGNDAADGTGTWTKLSGPAATITNPTLSNTTVTGLTDGTYKFIWSITFGACAVSLDTVMVTISAPVTTPIIGADQNICGTTATLTANSPVIGTGLWSQEAGDGGVTITSPTSSTTGLTGLTTGSYVFYWTISNNACPGSSDSVQLNVSTVTPVVPMAGPDQSVCGLSTVTMAANIISPGMGLWSVVSGPNAPFITNLNLPATTITGLEAGVYVFRWTSYGGEYCTPLFDEVTIDVTPAANAGPNQSACFANSANLTGNDGSVGTWTQVGVTPSVATIIATSSFSAVASGLIAGTYTFRYSVSANGSCGTPSTDDMTVTIFSTTAPASAGPDQLLCNVTSFSLVGNNPAPFTGTWTKVAGPAGGNFVPNANTANATFSAAVPGVYIFSWAISNSSCSSVDEVRITNYATPTIAAAGPDQLQVCEEDATMAANLPVNGLGTWSLVSKPVGASNPVITSPILPTTTITNLVPVTFPGTYVFRWTISNGVCASSSDDVSLTVYEHPTVADAGADQVFCNVLSTTLNGNLPLKGTGQWTKISGPAAIITAPAQYNSTVTGLTPGTYVFEWTTTLLPCSYSDQMTITNYALPTTASTAGTTEDICLFSAMNLVGNTPAVGTGTWTQTAGSPLFILSPLSPTTAVAGAAAESYSFQWAISNGSCPVSSSSVTINVAQNPTMALAGPDQSLCNTLTATFAGNTPVYGTGTWTQESGPSATINTPNNPAGTVTLTIPGTYEFKWEIATIAACTSSDHMQIVKNSDVTLTPPANVTICNGGTAILAVTAAGGIPPYTYQWEQSNDGSTGWANVSGGSGANTNSYTTPALASDLYYRSIATSSCGSGKSLVGHVTVVPDPVITVQPTASTTICSGTTTTLSVTATNGTPSLTYQWQSNTTGCGGAWANVGGATSSSYTTAALTQTTYYRVLVSASGNGCNTATSNCAIVYVPRITTNPVSSAICTGGIVSPLSIVVDGGTSILAYQWQSSPDNSVWGNVSGGSGANTAAYITDALTSTTYFRAVVTVTSPNCANLISNSSTITVVPDPTITIQPVSPADICSGGTTSNMTITATGGTPALIYKWQYYNGVTWNNVVNGTPAGSIYTGGSLATFSVSGISGAGTYEYRCEVSAAGNGCNTINSISVFITVIPDPTLTVPVFTIPTICAGGSTSVSSTISGGMAIPVYQWQYFSGSWNNVVNGTPAGTTYTNATAPTMTISGATAAGVHQYRLTTDNSSSCNFSSAGTSYTVVADPNITIQPASNAICTGGISSMSVTAAGGTPVLNYQWRLSPDNVTFSDIAGANSSGYTTPVLTTTTYYKVYISATGEGCGNVTSNTATIAVVPDPAITIQPVGNTICTGGTHTLSVSATGGTPALFYQWQISTTGGAPWTNVGANSNSYTTPALATTTYYQVVITAMGNDCNTAISTIATVTVVPDPTISVQPVGATICNGGNHSLSVTASGNPLTGALLYQWQSGPNTGSYTNISGATSSSYTSGALANSTYFRCVVTQAPSGCSITSADALVTVVADPGISTQPTSPAAICVGGTTTNITLVATGGTPSLVYQWEYFNGATWNSVANGTPAGSVYTGAASNTFSVAGISASGAYQYRGFITASGNGCGTIASNAITVTVAPDPAITTQPVNPADICVGGTTANMTLVATGGTPSLIYQWKYYNGATWNNVANGTPAGSTYTGSTAATFSVAGISAVGNYQYQCVVSATGNDCNPTTSNTVIVTVVADPTLTLPVFTNTSICAGGSTVVSSSISGGTATPTYQWQYYNGATWNNVVNGTPAGTAYTNATTLAMTIAGTTGAGVYQYRLNTINSSGCNYTSAGASYTVVADPGITTQPTSPTTICVGGTTTNISLVAAGGTPSLVYQWEYFNGVTWNSVANGTPAGSVYTGATSNTFSVAGISASGSYQYRCFITASGSGCGTITSNTITVNVAPDPAITAQPVSPAAICLGGTTSNITITASGGTPSLNYQWQYYNGATWNNVVNGTPSGSTYTGSTAATFSVTGISAVGNYQYQCVVSATGNDCNPTTSNPVIVTVNSSPAFTACPSNIAQNTDASQCDAVVNYTATATGTPAPVITYAFSGVTTLSGNGTGSGSAFNKGVTNVVVTATNSCGVVTCSFTVTVTDNESPAINTCPPTRNLSGCSISAITGPVYSAITAASSEAEFENATNLGASSDNCGITSVTYIDVATGSCPISVTRTWTVKDAAGNSTTCNQTITVADNTNPVAICKNVTVALNAGGNATITVADINNSSTDNCGIASLGASKTSFTCSDIGPNTVTLTVTDNCGNSSTCEAVVTVTDPVAPALSINDVTVNENAGNATFVVTMGNPRTCDVSFTVNTANNTAFAGSDYTTVSSVVYTLPAGSTSVNISVPIINDAIAESTETFFVNLSNPTNATISDASGLGTILDDDAVTLALSGFTVTEINGTQTENFVVTLNIPAQEGIVITFTTTNVTAISGSDYTGQATVSYTIPAGSTTFNIPVDILGDLIAEPTETFTGTIAISNANGQNVSITTPTATSTINDNDAVSVAINDVSVNENAGNATFTVTLTGNIQDALTVDYATADGTAMQSGDYTITTGTVTFPAGSVSGTTQTISVPIINDLVGEPTEAYTVNLSNIVSTGSASISDASGLGTILDNDAVTLALSGFTVTEINGTQTENFVVTLNVPAQEDIVITFTTANVTALSGSDYTGQTTVSYTIPAGSTTFNIPVDILGDLIAEPTETFTGTIAIGNANGQNVSITTPTATSTINDNDAVSVAINDVSVNENAGNATFTVTLTGNIQDALTVDYATADGTAMQPGDYTSSAGTVTFPAGSVSGATQTISVPIINDLVGEPTENYTVNLSNIVSTGSASINDASGLGTILDNDAVTLALSGFTVTEINGTQTENFVVTLNIPAQEDIVITFTTTNVTALSGSDFTGQTTVSYTIPAGSTTFNIPVNILGDLISEPTETFTGTIAISNANGQNISITTPTATSTILDSGSVSIAVNDVTVNENAGNATFTVTLTGNIQDALMVDYATANGTAMQPGDYTSSAGTVTFPAGSVSGATQTITVPIINDLVGEPTETYTVNLGNIVSTGSASISDASGLGTILDDDAVTLVLSGFTVTEINGTQTENFAVTLNVPAQEDIVITFTTTNVTAISGSDYTGQTTVSYTIPAGSTTFNIPVDILGDLISEPTETFTGTIAISNANGQNVSLTIPTATSTILDSGSVSVAINDVTVNENAGNATFTVTLTGTIQDALTVDYASADGTAMQPGDYTITTGTVTFPAGSVSGATQTITVPIINDLVGEPTETYTANLGNIVSTGSASISDASGLGTILDNDAVTLALSGFTVTEINGTQAGNFVVTLNIPAQEDIVITFTTTNVTALSGSDYTGQATVSYTIPAGSTTFNIPADILGDLIAEPTETFTGTIAISNVNGQNVSITTPTATSTINDNDAVSLAINDVTVNENAGNATFTVTLTGTIQDALTLDYGSADGTAMQPDDYTSSAGTVTFPAGSVSGTTQTISVPIINDLVGEPTETYTVNLSNIVSTGSVSISDASGLGTIHDDDAVTLALSGFTVTEINGTQTENFVVTLNIPAQEDIVITFTTTNVTAISGSDYTGQTTVSYTIPTGSTTFNIPVDILGDLISEPTETFTGTIAISNANGQNVSITTPAATSTILDSGSVSVAINDVSVNENAGNATFTVTLTGNIQDALTVDYATANGTAMQPGDYTSSAGTVTFPAGSVSGATQTISVPIINDLVGEPTETYTVNLSNIVSTGNALIGDASGLGTILDNDAVTLALSGFTVTEINGTQTENFVVTLNIPAQEDIVITFTTANVTALSGSDYTGQATVSYTIPAGSTTFNIPVDILGDLIAEPTETFTGTIAISNANGQNISITTPTATSTINDNDAVSIAINDVTVNENAGNATFTVTLTGNIQDALTVDYATADGTAMQPGDYTTSAGTVTFPAGSVSGATRTITVPIINDLVGEPTETYTVNLGNIVSTGSASISDASGLGTILDNDAVTLALSGFTVTEINGTQIENFVVTLNIPAQKDIVITFTTANVTALSGSDYTSQPTVGYTIPAGSTTFNIPVDILGDLISEPTETFTGTMVKINNNGQNVSVTTGIATATILDDDIIAVDDAGSSVNSYTGGTSVVNVLLNDQIYGSFPTISNVILSQVSSLDPDGISTADVLLNADGSVTVSAGTPVGNYTLTYQICEVLNPANCDQAVVTILVVAPVIDAVDDAGTVNGMNGGTAVSNVLANDELNGAPVIPAEVTLEVVTPAGYPGIVLNPVTGEVTVAPGTPSGIYTITYQICQILNPSVCDQAVVTITVTSALIVANDDAGSISGINGGTAVVDVLTNDLLNGNSINPSDITIGFISGTNPGVTLVGTNVVVAPGTPTGIYYVVYEICEVLNTSNCDQATVTVTVTNDPPSITGITASTTEDTPITICLPITDPDAGSVFTASICGNAVNGTLSEPVVTGSQVCITYTPNLNYNGTEPFCIEICDNGSPVLCDTAIITVNVIAANDAPVTINEFETTCNNSVINGNVLANGDNDPDGTALTVVTIPVSGPVNGSFTILSNGDYTYSPSATFAGTEQIIVSVCDNGIPMPSLCTNDTITITVIPAIIASAGVDLSTCENAPITISGASAQNVGSILWTTSGTGVFNDPALANPIYSPDVADLAAGSVILTMNVTGLAPCGDYTDELTLAFAPAPIANAGTDATTCNSSLFTLNNASADNYASLLWEYSPANAGTLSDATLLNPVFTSSMAFTGDITFTLKATGLTVCGTVVSEDDMILTVIQGIIVDAGIDQEITAGSITKLHGSVTGSPGPYAWSWEPSALLQSNIIPEPVSLPISQPTLFTLTVLDMTSGCSSQDEVLVLTPFINSPPVAVDDMDSTSINTTLVVQVLANDTDPDGNPLNVSICGNPANGNVVVNLDNTITYTPKDKFFGDDEFCYIICDDGYPALCDTAMVYIHVTARIDDLDIYNLLTPNGDNSNDAWIIRGIEDYLDNTVLIFNRWGDKVRDFSRYDNTNVFWDGTNKRGEILPSGTYYYILTIKNVGSRTGWIFLRGKED